MYNPLKVTNPNPIQRGNQTRSLGIMIGRCSLNSQHGGLNAILRMLAVLITGTQTTIKATTQFRDTKDGIGKTTNVLDGYFKSNSTQIWYGKRFIEIWTESTSQRPAV